MIALWTSTKSATTKFTTPSIALAFVSTDQETWKETTQSQWLNDRGDSGFRPGGAPVLPHLSDYK
jgi:hypothetical protein